MGWLGQIWERWFGYAPAGRHWRLYRTRANRAGLPERVPLPRAAWSAWAGGEEPLAHERLAEYAGRFAEEQPRHDLAPKLALFARKAPLAGQVEAALQGKDWAGAERLLDRLRELDPHDARARLLRALCLQNLGRLGEAQAGYAALAEQLTGDPDFHVFRAGLHEQRGEVAEAKADYAAALEGEPRHPLALERMAVLGEMVEIFLGDIEDPERAFVPVADYERTLVAGWRQEARGDDFYLERSEFHLRAGQPRLALRAAELAAEMAGGAEPAAVAAARCRALIALERYDAAGEAAALLQRLEPEGEATFACLGQLLWFRGDREQAVEWVMRAIEANPNRMENLHLYVNPEFPRPQNDALRGLAELLRRYPRSWAMRSLMASILMAAGDWKRGVRLAQEAARLGAADEVLVELTGRMGAGGRHAAVVQLAKEVGGWQRFLRAHALLRSNLAASLEQVGEGDAARELRESVYQDSTAHPAIRLRARAACEAAAAQGPS